RAAAGRLPHQARRRGRGCTAGSLRRESADAGASGTLGPLAGGSAGVGASGRAAAGGVPPGVPTGPRAPAGAPSPRGGSAAAGRGGGTVSALATAAGADGEAAVVAATAIGVYRSAGGGRTWVATGEGSSAPFVEAVVPSVHCARDRTLFAGARNGLYRSTDSG